MENFIAPIAICGVVVLILVVVPWVLVTIHNYFYDRHMEKNHRLYPEYYAMAKRRNKEFEAGHFINRDIDKKKQEIDELTKKLNYTPIKYQDKIRDTIEEIRKEIYPLEIIFEQHIQAGEEMQKWMCKYREEHNIKE